MSYIDLFKSGELKVRIEKLYKILESCVLCARKCRVNRIEGEIGFCHSGSQLMVSSFAPHFGEEPELVGKGGSGTVFLTNCNLGCLYCQNYDISHLGEGDEMSPKDLAHKLLYLQNIGCHNINFVTPTHFIPQIVDVVYQACQDGLNLPLVFNCGGYENVEIIKMLDGIFDIYMPDIKYSDYLAAEKFSQAGNYFEVVKEVVREMHGQVGDLEVVEVIAQKGLLVRHLILPNNMAGSEKVFEFVANEISKDTYVNIMDQYRPLYRADEFHEINRQPTMAEFNNAIMLAKRFGLYRGF